MTDDVMMETARGLAKKTGARAIVSFLKPFEFKSEIPVIWVEDLQLDVLKDLTMHDILEVSKRHLHDAAVQIYLSQNFEEGKVIGVFPYAILIYDIREGQNFISVREFDSIVPREVMTAVLTIAMDIAVEGREGRNVGTAFIIGDKDKIFEHSHQAIINPYRGQDIEDCDIRQKDNWESVKEFAQLDGVFVVSPKGIILAAGRYIDVNSAMISLPGGLGGRHRATAALTRDIPVIGVTVSESGGMIRVFCDGRCKLMIRADLRIRKG